MGESHTDVGDDVSGAGFAHPAVFQGYGAP
jgi:hypothetical protein